MIKNISFTGNIIINKKIKEQISPRDEENINNFSKYVSGDVFVEGVDKYKTGEPVYTGYILFRDRIKNFIFDTKYPKKSEIKSTQMPPEYY